MADEKKEKKTKSNKLGKVGVATQIFLILLSGVFLAVSAYVFIFFIFAMLPAIVTMTVDRRPGKYASSTVGAFNFIGVLPYMVEMFKVDDFNHYAKSLLTDASAWIYVYITAFIGCLLIWSIPQIVAIVFTFKMRKRVEHLQSEQKKLLEIWGDRLKSF